MFTIELYNNKAENNRLDKTNFITLISSISGTLREACSVISPSILIEDTGDIASQIMQCNYAHIPTFNRYYYITNITSVRNNLLRLDMSCDVLMSFKDEILKLECYIGRQEYEYDEYLPDDKMSMLGNEIIDSFDGVKGLYIKNPYEEVGTAGTNNIVLITMGYGGDVSEYTSLAITQHVYAVNRLQLNTLFKYIYTGMAITNNANGFIEPSQQIYSIRKYPFNILNVAGAVPDGDRYLYDDLKKIVMGQGVIASELFAPIDFNVVKFKDVIPLPVILGAIQITNKYNNFLDYAPYTIVDLYVPYLGFISLPTNKVMGKGYIVFELVVNFISDKDTINIYNNCKVEFDVTQSGSGVSRVVSYGDLIASYSCTSSIELPVLRDNSTQREIANRIADNKAIGGFVSKGISMVSDIASNPSNLIPTLLGGVEHITRNLTQHTNEKMLADRVEQHLGEFSGSINTPNISLQPIAIIRRPNPVYYSEPSDYLLKYAKLMGRPCSVNRTLGELYGYTEVYGMHIENIPKATSEELNVIETILRNGILLPDRPAETETTE